MTEYQHLSGDHQLIAGLPNEERIQWIRAERWINHPMAELALATMNDLLTYPQRNRMPCLLIHGRTGIRAVQRSVTPLNCSTFSTPVSAAR